MSGDARAMPMLHHQLPLCGSCYQETSWEDGPHCERCGIQWDERATDGDEGELAYGTESCGALPDNPRRQVQEYMVTAHPCTLTAGHSYRGHFHPEVWEDISPRGVRVAVDRPLAHALRRLHAMEVHLDRASRHERDMAVDVA